jgi:hypothetical protein
LPDPRQPGKVIYPLDEVLLLCLLAMLAGAETFVDIALFGEKKLNLLTLFGVAATVYVDGSIDGSVQWARERSVDVIELDMRIPFTAARARNVGFRRVREIAPDLTYVQFVDGDCEVQRDWHQQALSFLESHEDVAVVCGRRRERYPERSATIGFATKSGMDRLARCKCVAETR